MNRYRSQILASISEMVSPLRPLAIGLDLGAGDGWFTKQLMELGLVSRALGVELGARKGKPENVVTYDGKLIPFPDKHFDVTFIIDVLHHTDSVADLIKETARVTQKYIVVKDHTFSSPLGRLLLCGLDLVGNMGRGVNLPFHFQRSWTWNPYFEEAGFTLNELRHPLRCHTGMTGMMTNKLQYACVWKARNTPKHSHPTTKSSSGKAI